MAQLKAPNFLCASASGIFRLLAIADTKIMDFLQVISKNIDTTKQRILIQKQSMYQSILIQQNKEY